MSRKRRRNSATMVNPSRRIRRLRVRRRRNPGGSFLRQALSTAIPALVAGGALGFVDAKFLANLSPAARIGSKVAVAAGLGLLLRKRPDTARVAMAAVIGTLGYEPGVRAGGGVVAASKPAAMQEMALLIREDPEAMAQLRGSMNGMGMLVPASNADIPQPVVTALDVNLG